MTRARKPAGPAPSDVHSEGSVEDGLIAAGQVASAIEYTVHVAEFVPRMARQACEIPQTVGQRVRG
ncbi:hypothetical protein [Ottowia thiooxydans]|uniref:Uncharacterized protein n=1 Tax=Ottowia thiooxydans TaxID=219182 RepID=A0ABV2Q799_9BURK